MQGTFRNEALKLKEQFPSYLENNREDSVRIAIPDTLLSDGLLFATLPTEQSAGLPFHIDADFFPTSDRKSIAFEDTDDHRSEWNRAAIRAAASVVGDNLIPLRDMFKNEAPTFWAILDRLSRIYPEYANDKRKPFAAFWEVLRPSLQTSSIVYTKSRKWLKPVDVRIPTGTAEEEAVPVFTTLAVETVHRDLWKYRNILTRSDVGVQRLRVKDIYESLEKMELVGHAQPIPSSFQTPEKLELLWKGIHGILENIRGQSASEEAVNLLRRCALAPGLDGRLWPCGAVYQADKRTCEIFANLMPTDVSFLAKKGVLLLEVLCPQFVPSSAIKELERLDTETLQRTWRDGRFDPATLLKWFDDYKKELSKDKALCKRLACIPVFPSAGNLRSLENLYMPGGFEDPIGVADLVDMRRLKGLSDFLKFLGAEELTFEAYALEYIPMAFSGNSGTPPETKRKLLDILAIRIGEIRENEWLQDKLAETNIVECTDGEFRQPDEVYFPCKEVQDILRDFVHYACFPKKLKGRKELYRWLGVVSRPRPNDVLLFINNLTAKPPNQDSTQAVKRIMEAVGKTWATLDDNDKQFYDALKNREWILAEERQDKWYRPGQLYAAYNKHLFESQAKFLDMPFRIQQQINDFLKYLGVKLSPQSIQVVRHLLECSKHNDAPPNGIYQWLNDKVQPNHLQGLLDTACLRVKGKYFRKDQVFWGQHRFGRFRVQLGPEFKSYQNLLQALGIRESPDHNDAFKVLKEVSKEVGNKSLNSEEKDVVLQCWIMLAEALERTEIDDAGIKTALQDIKCVPNSQDLLQLPSWMFFEDRPSLADKFGEFFKSNLIPRTERIWQTMEAAGVRPISEAVQGDICEATNEREDQELKRLATERTDLINTISNGASQLDSICFIRADQLKVKWHTRAFKQNRSTSPESVSAHLNRNKKTIYFTLQRGSYPWSAIARELAQAIAPGEEISSISPGLKVILEADSRDTAVAHLNDLGIALTEELRNPISGGNVADSFGEAPPYAQDQEPPTSSQNGVMSGGETHPGRMDEPTEGGLKPVDGQDDVNSYTPNTTPIPTGADSGGVGYSTGNSTEKPTGTNESSHDKGEVRDSHTAGQQEGNPEAKSSRHFVSYVAVHSDGEEPNADGLHHEDRMNLEAKAIALILACEPDWQSTPTNNPGFDLYQVDEQGRKRLCEVKAMKGSLKDRPVGLSHRQFDDAREHGEAYWLYIVEHVSDGDKARIVRIQNPAGKARTFTFDRGWLDVAVVDTNSDDQVT